MADINPSSRIDAAIKRIEAAVARRNEATRKLTVRHETLRARVEEAISALDALERQDG
jgi:hypothetical protein